MNRSLTKYAVMTTAVTIGAKDHINVNNLRKSLHDRRTSVFINPNRRVSGFTNFVNENGTDARLQIRDLLINWSENTTMHGVKYLWEKSDVKLRRYLWLLFVFCGICFMIFFIGERIFYFYQHPVTVNVEINYNSTIIFPAITICNQNSFRLTKANKFKFYDTLESIYQHGNIFNQSTIHAQNLNTSMEVIYNLTSFQIEDMLIKCTWNGIECYASNFSYVVTEQGICIGFNHNQNLSVTDTGSPNGLSLLLNVQQYEYMAGPITSTGVRFLLHEASTYPKVMDLGEAVPTGTHTYIGTKVTLSTYLSRPHGNCSNEIPLEYFNKYNQHNCRIECETNYIVNECKCRPFFMPKFSNATVCTLFQHNDCYLTKKILFKQLEATLCKHCDPLPCVSTVYEPSLSYASISKYVLSKLMSDENLYNKISHRLIKTRDIASHVVYELRQRNLYLMTRALKSNENLRNTLLVKAREILQYNEDFIRKTRLFHENSLRQKIEATKFQMEIVNKDFVRGAESADERTLSLVSHQLFEFFISFESYVKQLQRVPLERNQERSVILHDVSVQLKTRRLCAIAAYDKVQELFHCYSNALPYWFNTTSGNFTMHERFNAIPASLLKSSINNTYSQKKNGYQVLNDLVMLNFTYMTMSEVLNFITLNGNKSLPLHLNLTRIYADYKKYSTQWLNDRSNFLHDVFYFPAREMRRRLLQLKEIEKKLHDFFEDLELSYFPITKAMHDMETHWMDVDHLMNVTNLILNHFNRHYVHQSIEHKSNLSILVKKKANSFIKFESRIEKMSDLLKMHSSELTLFKLKEELQKMWSFILNDEDSWTYYRYKNWKWYNLSWANFVQEIENNFTDYQNKMNFKSIIGHEDRHFIYNFRQYIKDLIKYYDESQINDQFYKNNIVKLDIFFREMSFEKIVQQKAYKISALMGDIGGMLGLFIGASFLTILEIFDFLGQIIFQAHRQPKLKKEKLLYTNNKKTTSL